MRNIELFDANAVHIFATLHDAFPLPRRIETGKLAASGLLSFIIDWASGGSGGGTAAG